MKIDSNGGLWLRRRGVFRQQFCIHTGNRLCGDTCPLFGDPESVAAINGQILWELSLCEETVQTCLPEEFIDEREAQ